VELDLRGLKCPLPVLRARKALVRLTPGDELTVFATDPMAAIDLPHMCREDGHRLVLADQIDARTLRFLILCRPHSAEPAREA
jgi:tRNA 2-thiouridine synthesizing protein A